jgi:hypothetical protein
VTSRAPSTSKPAAGESSKMRRAEIVDEVLAKLAPLFD